MQNPPQVVSTILHHLKVTQFLHPQDVDRHPNKWTLQCATPVEALAMRRNRVGKGSEGG